MNLQWVKIFLLKYEQHMSFIIRFIRHVMNCPFLKYKLHRDMRLVRKIKVYYLQKLATEEQGWPLFEPSWSMFPLEYVEFQLETVLQ